MSAAVGVGEGGHVAWLTEDRHVEGDQPTTPRRASYIPAATLRSVTQSNAPREIPSRAILALASRAMPPVLLSNTGRVMKARLICLVRRHQWHNGWDEERHLTVWTCKRCGATKVDSDEMGEPA